MTEITDKKLLRSITWDDADGWEMVTEELGVAGRWRQHVTTIARRLSDGKLFAIEWQRGLTENCDHDEPTEGYEVEPVTKTKTITRYVKVAHGNQADRPVQRPSLPADGPELPPWGGWGKYA